jgi:ubiquinone/menaquinone biosynthesis C-methylase UbiE
MLAKATERAGSLRGRYNSVQCDAARMDFADGAFDTVVCTLAGCTFPDPPAVFREMSRVCAPDGRLLFLEHTRARDGLTARMLDAITPVTRRMLGCHANRDFYASLSRSGLAIRESLNSAGSFVAALETRPVRAS